MATHSNFLLLLLLLSFTSISSQQNDVISSPQVTLDSTEQESVYKVLESINSAISWRTIFPDDLCVSSPDGVVCDYFFKSQNDVVTSVHVTEFHLGYISDYTQNPPCSSNSTLNPLLFTSFKFLRKIFFYKCFTGNQISLPETISEHFGSVLEEFVFIENPSLVGNLSNLIGNFTNLKRLVLTGNGFHGSIPDPVKDLTNLEEITLSRNRLSGNVPMNLTSRLSKLKVLDLSHNFLDGNAPGFDGDLTTELIKLDLSFNGFTGEIPYSIGKLRKLEFLDLSYNRFGNFGVPLFLAEMLKLKEVYLSGNKLGGAIPEIWDNLGGILGIGFSKMGLEGNIPVSMASSLKNLCYLALDNNNLKGEIPKEFEFLEFAREISLENNNFTGKVPFSDDFRGKLGKKLKINGNPGLIMYRSSLNSDPPLTGPGLTSSASRAITSFYELMGLAFLSFLMKQ